ncbi:MAG: undecaprenyl-diphosphate phosphatase [Rhizobiaceae bacterium]|nr:undecaprenyl-diphosphate phosphatase [Rhizobiaceae bacterium]MBL4697162.1 undecaprenyl-diphosphate phosphatase [Rhizobiaceae bacterium]
MSPEQIIVLAIVQGITEFLPISSSGHLILIPAFTDWPDQGIVTDVMVHLGSLLAVIVYFWRDVLNLIGGGLDLLRFKMTDHGKMALFILVATIPAVIFGLYLKSSGMSAQLRSVEIIAWNAIIFGIVLYVADRVGKRVKVMEDMTIAPALIIGLSQALALIPGTSRSGITMSAARFLGFERAEAARFSFLLGIPAIAGAGILTLAEFVETGQSVPTDALWAAFLTFFSAIAAIAFLMAMVKRMSFLIFVLYRLALGLVLFALLYNWIPGINLNLT